MKRYQRVIFVSTGNTFLSPLAEAIYRYYADESCPISISRGLVVLFSEPINPKVNILLSEHHMGISRHVSSQQLKPDELGPDTLLLAMTFSEKVTLLEEYKENNVYTLGEYVGEDTDMKDPCGGEEEQYEQCFEDTLRRIKMVINKIREEGKRR